MANVFTTLGDLVYSNSAGAPVRRSGNITTTKMFLSQTGDGSVSAAPQWSAVTAADTGSVPTSRTITINGTTQDLSADRTYSVGTVTSVAALTLGTTGTDISSSVANGTTTPVITLNIPTASAANRGALSSADWTTFNAKQPALSGTGFVKISGTTISYDNSTYYLASNPSNYITLTSLSAGTGISYNNTTGVISSTITQYTDALARASISETITGIDYNNTTGVFSITSGYAIPTTASQTEWDSAYNNMIVSAAVTGTTTKTLTLTQQDAGTITASWTDDNTDAVTSVFGRTGAVIAVSGDYTTTLVTEGTNLYFTNARAIASTLTGYVSGAGTISSADTILGAIQKLNGNIGALTTGVSSVNGLTGAVTLTTTNIAEGTNLYYTDTRARASLSFVAGSGAYNSTTGVITIPTNTNELTNGAAYITLTSLSAGTGISYNNTTGVITSTITQYTDALARLAISESVTGLDYDNITGAFTLTSGYVIPTTTSATNWDAAYNDKINSAAVTGTTTKTLTLTQQDGGTITASWTDINTDAVTSVFGRTGAVVATSGDYTTAQVTESGNLYYTDARARAAISLTTSGSSGSSTYNSTTGVLNVPTYTASGLGAVPTSRTITINDVVFDLSANREWSVGDFGTW
jgi:hypothetical protein